MFGSSKESLRGMGVYAIYDSDAAAFGTPLVFPAEGLAIRAIKDALRNKDSAIAQNPHAVSLFRLGRYDNVTGEMIPLTAPEKVIAAVQLLEATIPNQG